MSYLMILRVQTDGASIERVAQEQGDNIREIAQRGKAAGAIHHAFYGTDSEVLVVDEWESPEDFQKFFEAEQANIGPLMQAAGAQGEPQAQFFRKLDTGDDF